MIISDTGSYSDIVFGLLPLLGFDYRPQLTDLPDTKLWRINASADYGPLDATAQGRTDLARVRRHWPDILRLVASIHTGRRPARRTRTGAELHSNCSSSAATGAFCAPPTRLTRSESTCRHMPRT